MNAIEEIVANTLALTVPAIQRRIAIEKNMREVDRLSCFHEWDPVRRMCTNCGETAENLHFKE